MSAVPLLRIVDASLNRAGEGLRVVEDYLRFVLDDPFLTAELKTLRHELLAAARQVASEDRHTARDTLADVGTAVAVAGEGQRGDTWDVCAASFKRTAQSLRGLEEYGKLLDSRFAQHIESLRYRLYTLEKATDLGRSSRRRLEGVRLCVLVDGCESDEALERLVSSLVEAGVGMIQLRDKQLNDRELVGRARRLVSLTRRQAPHQPPAEQGADDHGRRRTLAIVNDRPDIAAAVQADGVHLGQEDLTVKDARSIVGTRALIGVSTHHIEQARAAVLDGANYLGAGPTFVSHTKSFDTFAGTGYLRQLAAETRLPTFAIGGITMDTLSEVLATGITRVAVGAAVIEARDPSLAAGRLVEMLTSAAPAVRPSPSSVS